MSTPLAKGVIIVAAALVAAGMAAYESPEVRDWFQRSSQKVMVAFQTLGDDISRRSRRTTASSNDASTREMSDEAADERRRRAREEILEKGRILELRRRSRKDSNISTPERSLSFDSLVDRDGKLKTGSSKLAITSAFEMHDRSDLQHEDTLVRSPIDGPTPPDDGQPSSTEPIEHPLWESQYERELIDAWHIELPSIVNGQTESHASESLIDLTPTTEDFADPDYSIPSLQDSQDLQRRQYFLTPNSRSSHTSSHEDSALAVVSDNDSLKLQRASTQQQNATHAPVPTTISLSEGGLNSIPLDEVDTSGDDFSEVADGLRTPGSTWTDIASSVGEDDWR